MQVEDKVSVNGEIAVEKDRGVYVGVEEDDDNQTEIERDDLGEIWQEMYMSLEVSKVLCFVSFLYVLSVSIL